MKIFEKIKRFIRRIFVDYGEINRIFDNNVKALEEKISNHIATTNENEKRREDIIENIKEEQQQITNSIEEENRDLRNRIELVNTELKYLKEQFKYSNTELLNIKYDKSVNNILLVGFYGAPNLGDELMLETLLEYLENIPNKKITILLADNPAYSIDKYKDVRFIHYPKTLYDFNVIAEQFDYIIFGGGAIIDDSHYDKENSYQYDIGTIFIKLSIRAIAFNKKVICIALSASEEILNTEYLEELKYIIQNSHYFSVRDDFTKKYLIEKLGDEYGKKIIKIHDIVFANKEILNNIVQNRVQKDILNIGIIAITNEDKHEKIQTIITAIKNLKKETNINLIPFYDYGHIDKKNYYKICDNNKDIKINIEKYPENMIQTIDLCKKNDIIIGMRYHSILISNALNIPCISICYDIHSHYPYKIKYLNKTFEKNDALSYINLDEKDIYRELQNVLNNNNNNLELSKQILIEAEEQLNNIIDSTFNINNRKT